MNMKECNDSCDENARDMVNPLTNEGIIFKQRDSLAK